MMIIDQVDIRSPLGKGLEEYASKDYKTHEAIAEFVDNSTQSYFDNRALLEYYFGSDFQLIIRITYKPGLSELIVEDNAFGMDEETFKYAITIGAEPKKKGGRNRFGMGLKTAASWFGHRWQVETTTLNEPFSYSADVDINKLISTEINKIDVDQKTTDLKNHGTKVTIKELRRPITDKNLQKLERDLISTYRRDITENRIVIYLNDKLLEYKEPEPLEEIIDGENHVYKKYFDRTFSYNGINHKITGFYALRKTGSYNDSGFTLFQNNRVVIGGFMRNYKPEKIFQAPNSFISLRLYGEVNMEDFPITQMKNSFDWEADGLEDAFIDELYDICKDYIKVAKDYRATDHKHVDFKKIEVKSMADSLVNDLSSIGRKEISVDEDSVRVEKNIDTKPQTCSYSMSLTLFKIKYNVTVNFNEVFDGDLLYVSSGYPDITIDINLAFPMFLDMKYNAEFINIMQKILVLLVIAEKYCEATTPNENGYIKVSDIRNTLSQILFEMSQNDGGSNGFFNN